jgi:hypothetical protein
MQFQSLWGHEDLMIKTGNATFRFLFLFPISSTKRGSLPHIILFTCPTSRNRTGPDLESLLITKTILSQRTELFHYLAGKAQAICSGLEVKENPVGM